MKPASEPTDRSSEDDLPSSLVRDAARVEDLDRDEATRLLQHVDVLRVYLWSRLHRPPDPPPGDPSTETEEDADGDDTPSWRERIWTCPAETRLGTEEAAEALGRPVSWIHKRTGEKTKEPALPYGKLGGILTFKAGELRAWIRKP